MLIINLGRMEGLVPPDAPDLKRQLADARRFATHTLDELRKVVYDLRPTMLDDLGLGSAIRWYARSHLEEAGIRVRFDGFDETMRLAPELETTLFRVAHYGRRAGVEVSPHTLRHSFAKNLIDAGVTMEKVAALMGTPI